MKKARGIGVIGGYSFFKPNIMANQIIKQPNGKYCIYSLVVDSITHYDMTEDEIVRDWTEQAHKDIKIKVRGIIDDIEKGNDPYYIFTMTFDDMIDTVKEIHGESEAIKLKNLMK